MLLMVLKIILGFLFTCVVFIIGYVLGEQHAADEKEKSRERGGW
jgi:flagellar basal body-associated protein FliL